MSYGNKVDGNHADLRDNVFRKLAREVVDSSQSGGGISDLIVLTFDDELLMVEIKDGSKPSSARRLTSLQKKVALQLGDKFLVAKDVDGATNICIYPHWRVKYTGIKYMEETK